MCIMGNGNDPPAHIPSWKFPDERHKITEYWPNALQFRASGEHSYPASEIHYFFTQHVAIC